MALQMRILILLCIFPGIHFSSQSQIPRIKNVLVWKHFMFYLCAQDTHRHTHTYVVVVVVVIQSLSLVQLFVTPWTAARQASLSFTGSSICSNSCPFSRWYHPTISFSVTPSPLAFSLSQPQDLFHWVGSLHQVGKVFKLQLQHQHQSFQWIFRVGFL